LEFILETRLPAQDHFRALAPTPKTVRSGFREYPIAPTDLS